jgi:hypothetical protein
MYGGSWALLAVNNGDCWRACETALLMSAINSSCEHEIGLAWYGIYSNISPRIEKSRLVYKVTFSLLFRTLRLLQKSVKFLFCYQILICQARESNL